jgi:hypothetical protein
MDRATLYARGLPLPGTAPAVMRANRSGLRPKRLAPMKRTKKKEGEALKEHLSPRKLDTLGDTRFRTEYLRPRPSAQSLRHVQGHYRTLVGK